MTTAYDNDLISEVSTETTTAEIALVGNPNTGKTALFNRLTGARQRIGNYPGVTVEKKTGPMVLGGRSVSVIDLPGAYSLASTSADEAVVFEVLAGRVAGTRRPDLVVCVVDASNLARNLFLASQVADLKIPIVIALNMWDTAESQNIKINIDKLSKKFGVPVVATVAKRGRGVDQLKDAIAEALAERSVMKTVDWPKPVVLALDHLREYIHSTPGRSISHAERVRILFEKDPVIAEDIGWGDAEDIAALTIADDIMADTKLEPMHAESILRYQWIDKMLVGVVDYEHRRERTGVSESIDQLLTHRFFGLVVFVGIMYLVFLSIYQFAGPFMELINDIFGAVGVWAGGMLESTPVIQSLVVDGLIAGIGGVVVFLPQILILFFFIAMLEDTGYMTRAAFLMDKLFSWCGLNGKSFVPMLSSYACGVPGVMAARTIEDPKARLATILVAPMMSCSARLPVYVLLIGAFIEPRYGGAWAGFALFAMHFVGLFVAIPAAFVLNRLVLRGRHTPFVLEMPPYRIPHMRDVFFRMYERGKQFMVTAGTVIFAMSIVIWAMCYFPRTDATVHNANQQYIENVAESEGIELSQAKVLIDGELAWAAQQFVDSSLLEQSYMGRLGKFVQPVFAPAGFDWKITMGVLASFPAREVIIATLGITYGMGEEVDEESQSLVDAMKASTHPDGRAVYSIPVAFSIMVFFALCMQCGATVATIVRESNWKWALFAFSYMTVLAWVGAVVVYQVGSLI